MSGIAAIYNTRGGAVPKEELSPLIDAIAHRGAFESAWSGDAVALAMRLHPTTPEAAAERLPVEVLGGAYQVSLDGRFDNRPDLAAQLGLDLRERPVTDQDLIAHAYDRWGPECVERFIGDFAFIIWDRRSGRLVAARDQKGFRPLVYARYAGRLLIGSEPRQLLSYPGISSEIDELFLACHLTGAVPPQGSTPYASVSEVPAAHYMVAEGDRVELREYWRMSPRPLIRYRRREDYVEHFEMVFGEAVASSLRSVGRPGILLSGGLDSSYVVSRAVEFAPDIVAYTAYAEGTQMMDERPQARAVCERLGVEQVEVPVEDCWGLSSDHVPDSAFDQPHHPMQSPLMINMGRVAGADGVSVLLDGVGGDEFMAGGNEYVAELILSGRVPTAIRETRAWSTTQNIPLGTVLAKSTFVPLIPTSIRTAYRAVRRRGAFKGVPPWVDGEAVRRLGLMEAVRFQNPNPVWRQAAEMRRGWSFHVAEELPTFGWRERRAFLPFGVEARSPFWDLRLVELMLRFPSWVHREAGRPKALLREAMRPRLPAGIVERDDKGLYQELLVEGLLVRETERVDIAIRTLLSRLPYLNGQALARDLEVYRGQQHVWWYDLWKAIGAGLWLHFDEASRGHALTDSLNSKRGGAHARSEGIREAGRAGLR